MEGAESVMRALLGASGGHDAPAGAAHADDCYCIPHMNHGSHFEHVFAMACSWSAFALSIILLIFYGYHSWKATVGWEEVYVCIVERAWHAAGMISCTRPPPQCLTQATFLAVVKVVLEIFAEKYSPATIIQINGTHTIWLRYAEWLLTCPVSGQCRQLSEHWLGVLSCQEAWNALYADARDAIPLE